MQDAGQSANETRLAEAKAPAQVLPSRSPTPDLAVPSAPAQHPLDTDMTLPWDEPLDQPQPPDQPRLSTAPPAGNPSTAGNMPDPTQANEPADLMLPDTQATDVPEEGVANGGTTLALEPTQIAQLPDEGPSSPPMASKLASAAAEAMTGAEATQASGLPASGATATSMPSLALPVNSAAGPSQQAGVTDQHPGRHAFCAKVLQCTCCI